MTIDAPAAAAVAPTGATVATACDGLTAIGIMAAESAFFAATASTVFLDATAVMGCPSTATGTTLGEGDALAAVATGALLISTGDASFGCAAVTNGPATAAGTNAGGGG